ncbi:MAG TPA: Gfo/Idh/MocA family oxidoreductase [Gemmatimonadales bacterium]|nr:Gfo/Idh/MocA family oxidoreductase [Gemmatimonadales bacterium]
MGKDRPLRIGFIGAGNMAGIHLKALRHVRTPHTIVGVYDARPAVAQAFARLANSPVCPTLSALLDEARPEIVHVCTPAGMHFEPARQALLAGAHVYVEKPFVETLEEGESLLRLANQRGLLICAGHQLVRDPAFTRMMARAADLRPITLVDSTFAFCPPRLDPGRGPARALAEQLLDIVPHPLYTLVAALEAFGTNSAPLDIVSATATPTLLHALLRKGEVTGRLCVSLRARPVSSTLTVSGAHGALTTDFVRAIVLGAANEGTSPIEKIANPFVEAAQLVWRSFTSLTRRLLHGAGYPGLAELIGDFYAAAAAGHGSPLAIEHLRRVTAIYEQLAATVRHAVTPAPVPLSARAEPVTDASPVAVVTGAGGFFGRAICRALARRGFRVRGVGRSAPPDDRYVHEWVRADLGDDVTTQAFAGAAVVVHAAAETAGGFEAHERNTIGATRHVLRAMAAARVSRLVYVSTISVLRPPRPGWEVQIEATPLATDAERLGPYTWGKVAAEELVAGAHARREIEAHIIRPAALIDWAHVDFPGLLGRRLFGRWHLGLGRPGLPFAVCEVGQAAGVVAWCADRFADAPPVINLLDPAIRTRADLLRRLRERGWRGRMVWVPISVLAGAVMTLRFVMGLMRRGARPMAVWSILRSRRYDPAVSSTVLAAARLDPPAAPSVARPRVAAEVSQVYG